MATDSRISYQMYPNNPWKLITKDGVTKIHRFQEINVGVSYWGQAEFNGKAMIKILEEFWESKCSKDDDVNSMAAKAKSYFEGIGSTVKHRMGLHIAGYIKSTPKLRHVFHEYWHKPGIFTDEDCHSEYHLLANGNKVIYRSPKDYPVLFNGDNLIANALFNYAPSFRPYYAIIPHKLDLDTCIELAKLIIGTSIHRLNYYFDQRMQENKIPADVGGPICIVTITKDHGICQKEYDPKDLKPLEKS